MTREEIGEAAGLIARLQSLTVKVSYYERRKLERRLWDLGVEIGPTIPTPPRAA